jgi:hypothetical protein
LGNVGGNSPFFKVLEYLLDERWVFYAGNDMHGRINAASAWMRMSGDLDWAFALLTDTDVNIKHPF